MGSASISSDAPWFGSARYGLFLHWGLYSVLGHGEWAIQREAISAGEYAQLLERFEARAYDPRSWARLAREAGMRYAVMTTKHHDGFCLWDSRGSDFKATRSAAGRDLVAEFVEAFRAEGLRVGFYYSLGDFRHPDWRAGWRGDEPARARFVAWTHAMVEELMTGYGRIDILWYDLPQNYTAAEWGSTLLNARVRELQPGIVINNRAMTPEDFGTPEQHVTAASPGRAWEACLTLNENWGYVPSDRNFKTPTQVAEMLARCASGGGNLLLNVGPDGEGRIPSESESILRKVGEWLGRCGEAVYPVTRNQLPWNLWGPTTTAGRTMYLFLHRLYGPEIVIGGLRSRALSARLLGADASLSIEQAGRRTLVRGLPSTPPDPVLPVLALELDGQPMQDLSEDIGGADVMAEFPN